MKKSEIIKILNERNLAPNKRLGQNFLINEKIINLIVSEVNNDDIVLEIGPGLGALTLPLLLRCKKLTAIELDGGFSTYLNDKYQNYENFELINKDFIKSNVDVGKYTKIVSNLPYYLTTNIIEKVIISMKEGASFIFMVEEDVSTRIEAEPKSRKYGPLSIFLTTFGKIEKLVNVPKSSFYPEPKINSIVYKFTKTNNFGIKNEKKYMSFLQTLFKNRRKMLQNNMLYVAESKKEAINILNLAKLPLSIRPEEVTVEQFVTLFYITYTKEEQ
ncbi:MAG: 16S rRNA (adenine(1518)-N(6)/adenine(1519)-N(6))-dimethyltransferase RsmA [Bacilli bacterium]|jgi:16S rRNA (adenine1518-N6/adenine1519-N6)-dimethyltransferase